VSFLLARGANPNYNSTSHVLGSPEVGTALMWTAFAEAQDTELVSVLLAKGADVNAQTADGQTALSRAQSKGNSPVVDVLLRAGANDFQPMSATPDIAGHNSLPTVNMAVERSLALLLNSSAVWYNNRACVSCHNQTLPATAVALAKERGFQVDERSAAEQSAKTAGRLAETREPLLQMMTAQPGVGGGAHSAGYALLALAAEKHPADDTTDAIVRFIASKQLHNGRWRPDMFRPPLEYSDFSATALCLHALKIYGTGRQQVNYQKRIESARQWLSSAQPRFNEERVFQLLGLMWAGASRAELGNVATALVAEQRKDGGWSQLRSLESDAYATGQALFALHGSGVPASDIRYQRGVKFLLETQGEDGSWWVRSRSFPIQPYFDSGFPHGKDQFISAAGTSWAAMALALTREPLSQ
jgi:hypothetical protein